MRHLQTLYETERARLLAMACEDSPQGEYAAPVFGVGDVAASVMLIGEAPGAEETKEGCPFVGKAGKQLNALLALIGISRQELFITNVVKYRPVVRSTKSIRNRTPSKKEITEGLSLLSNEIAHVCPKYIVTLGNTPLQAILTLSNSPSNVIGDVHGRPMQLQINHHAFILFPLYHPASGIYNRSLVSVMESDACILGEHLVKAL